MFTETKSVVSNRRNVIANELERVVMRECSCVTCIDAIKVEGKKKHSLKCVRLMVEPGNKQIDEMNFRRRAKTARAHSVH